MNIIRRLKNALQPISAAAPEQQTSALQSEIQTLRESCEHHKRVTAEIGILMGKLRDERDSYKLQWEAASLELRRVSRLAPHASVDGRSASDKSDVKDVSRLTRGGTSSLRILCVGTGRDGTTSLSRIMQDVFDQREAGETAQHEWATSELNTLFCNWVETKDPTFEAQIRELILHCPSTCVTGNGYAAVLPIIAELLGDQVTLVHLRRRDRAACIASLVENAEVAPQNHCYYASSPIAASKRPAAFHFGEMSREQWLALSMHDKFGWYYDKTHGLIEKHKTLFARTLAVDTEDLDDESVRTALARVAGSERTPRAFHVNRFVDLRHVPPVRRSYVQRLLGQLDVQKLARDDLYGIGAVLNEFIFHLAHFPDEAPGALDELRWTLVEAHRMLNYRVDDLKELMERIGISSETPQSSDQVRPTNCS
ncbi:hypothetical protein ACU4GH_36065 [Bradyrhizobium betae]